ncbi:hypothetical protein SPKIRA_18460 [Sphingomonas paucimobilis]|uniref:Mrp/NBP35 family ATP-binding protein n=1 Tax=Sphingomonas paucimobilis TaxID=13689 RepID=UPI0015DD1A24|nr:hypothetical protein SPKIRA_18460 [Sphingomonas paucimobilis]
MARAARKRRRPSWAFLGRVPLTIAIRTASDAGQPPAAGADDAVFGPIAAKVAHWLERSTPGA